MISNDVKAKNNFCINSLTEKNLREVKRETKYRITRGYIDSFTLNLLDGSLAGKKRGGVRNGEKRSGRMEIFHMTSKMK